MKLALVGPYPLADAPPVGGVEAFMVTLTEALIDQGLEVHVVAPGLSTSEERRGRAFVSRVEVDSRLGLPRRLPRWRAGVERALKALSPDIVHAHGLLVPALGAVTWTEAPVVVTAHGNVLRDAVALYRGLRGSTRGLLVARIARSNVAAASTIIGVSQDWRVNVPLEPREFVWIPPAVDPAFANTQWRPTKARVVFCGGSHPIKGWATLRDAWRLLHADIPEATLDVLGWADPASEQVTVERGISIRGHVGHRAVRDAMARAAVVVVPSAYEVSPTVVAEAWTVGAPVLATAVGGVPAMAAGAAALVGPNDPYALAECMSNLIRSGCNPFAEEAHKRALAYALDSVVAAHLRIYERTLCRWSGRVRNRAEGARSVRGSAEIKAPLR